MVKVLILGLGQDAINSKIFSMVKTQKTRHEFSILTVAISVNLFNLIHNTEIRFPLAK